MNSRTAPPTVQSTAGSTRITPRTTGRQSDNARLVELERRVGAIEDNALAPTIRQVPTGLRTMQEYNRSLKDHLTEAYEKTGETWDLNSSLKDNSTNERILGKIKDIFLQMDFARFTMGDSMVSGTFKSSNHKKVVEKVVRNQLAHLKRTEKAKSLPAERKARMALKKKMNERKLRKLRFRQQEFGRLNDQLPVVISGEEPLSHEECAPLLVKEAMSDEEDDEMVRGTVAKTFKVKRPNWRSERVNKLFQHLDDLHVGRITQHYQQKERSGVEVVAVELSAELRRSLPAWAIRE
ncbi:unnamed protein product [Mucor hiemalis]